MGVEVIEWQESFLRECGIRRGVILHGNMIDVVPNPNSPDRWIPISEAIVSLLKTRGYTHVVLWDRVSGLSGVDAQTWRQLQIMAVSTSVQVDEGEEYDLGSTVPSTAPITGLTVTPIDFLNVVAYHMRQTTSPERIAFVVDWTQYLFGSANSLSEAERGWLLLMGKATRDAHISLTAADAERPQTMMVLLCHGLTVLPPALYQNNPLFKEITVPLPSRKIRESTVLQLSTMLNVNPPIRPQTRVLTDLTDSLEGLTLRDIHSLARLSRQMPQMTSEALVNLYRYGKKDSPWEQLNREKLKKAETTLAQRVKGQDEAIKAVNQVLIRAYTGLSGLQHSHKQRTPKGVLFFVGPTGVGKTELAKSLAHFLFGDDEACLRFDMSEFNHEHADQRLVGAPPGYVGYEEGGQLTNAIKQRPFSLLLFDEIEKAHPRILDKFLQILEDGRLTDGKGDTVLFSETVIVFTSNIGASEVKTSESNVRSAFIEKVREHFIHTLKRPELLGRIGEGNIIPFNFVTNGDFLVDIARVKLEPLRRRLQEKWGISSMEFKDETKALQAIVNTADSSAGGRGVLNAMITHLFDPLAQFLFNEIESIEQAQGHILHIEQAGTQVIFDFELR